jgi:spermidine/putrescine transport system substrate-binding protein
VPSAYVAAGDRAVTDRSATDRRLTWANWPLCIDTDDDDSTRRPTLDAFRERTGISVDHVEEINDNDEFFGKVSPALMNHQQTGRDLVVVSDWMCARFVRLGWVQEMDRANQPNVTKYLDPLLRSPAFDPGRAYTVPWQSGITGIAYNRGKLGREIRHVKDLWAGGGPRTTSTRSATRSRSTSGTAGSAASPATTTPRTSSPVTSWPVRPTPET